MLKLWRQAAASDPHRNLFLERYSQILDWALKLTGNRREQAEDLVQDTFVFLVNSRPDLSRAHNLEAYLYVLVRNLHRAQLQKVLRRAALDLAVLEFDSADAGLRRIPEEDDEDRLRVQNELRRICWFALRRQETSRGGSILILRFFHGYYPREIASILCCSRAGVDERLRQARTECRLWLNRQCTPEIVPAGLEARADFPEPPLARTLVTNEALLGELRAMIFSAPKGPCSGRGPLREMYRKGSGAKPDQPTVAHIVCCSHCLDAINDILGFAKIADRDPNDTTGYGSASSPSGAGKSGLRLHRPKPSAGRPTARQISQWERHAAGILEHRPTQLRIAVNGQPLVTDVLNSEESDITVTVPIREQVDFVEILSEQDVRLAMLVVAQPPPLGDLVQTAEVALSGGRTLRVILSFDSPWPTIRVTYSEPSRQASDEKVRRDDADITPAFGFLSGERPGAGFRFGEWRHTFARRLSSGAAILTILALLFVRTHQTSAGAAVLIGRAEEWQRTAAKPGMVLHRTFDLIERPKHSSLANRKRVEVWRKPDAQVKVSRLFDPSGKLLSSVRVNGTPASLTSANAWQFDPAPDSFRRLAGDLDRARVEAAGGQLALVATSARLTLDQKTFAPSGEVIQTDDAEFEFREISTEPAAESSSPLAMVAEVPAPVTRVPNGEAAVAAAEPATSVPVPGPGEAELEQAEISARVALHDLKGDLGEEIQVRRRGAAIEVAGVVDSRERKDQLTAGLSALRYVRATLLSPEDLSSSLSDRVAAALITLPGPAPPMHPPLLEMWLETTFPREPDRRAFAVRMVELARDCARRGLAIRTIAQRYGKPADPRLFGIVAEHMNSIRQDMAALSLGLAPALNTAGDGPASEPASWNDAATSLFENARALESAAVVLLTASNADGSDAQTIRRNCRQAQLGAEAALLRLTRMD